MTDIPEDIRAAAVAVVDRGYNVGLIDAVCEALMEERERAAQMAIVVTKGRERHETRVHEIIADTIRSVGECVAHAIRSPDTPTPQEER